MFEDDLAVDGGGGFDDFGMGGGDFSDPFAGWLTGAVNGMTNFWNDIVDPLPTPDITVTVGSISGQIGDISYNPVISGDEVFAGDTGQFLGAAPGATFATDIVGGAGPFAVGSVGLGALDSLGATVGSDSSSVVLSGHGWWDPANGMTTVPPGTSFTTYTGLGNEISDAFGNAIETGGDLRPFAGEMNGAQSYLPGAQVPNFTLGPPNGLDIMGNPVTVSTPTNISQILQPGMGHVQWAACCSVPH